MQDTHSMGSTLRFCLGVLPLPEMRALRAETRGTAPIAERDRAEDGLLVYHLSV